MGPEGLAQKIGRPPAMARELLALHRATYPRFWRWSQAAVDRATLTGKLETVFGWPIHVGPSTDPTRPGANPRSLANFPCQANGAEMLRLACCLLVERGIGLCAPVHDALLIEAPLDELDEAIINYMKRAYNLMIGERTAEEIKLRIGSAFPLGKETTMEVKGRDMVAGLPKTITITSQEVREAMLEPLNAIIDAVRTTLERCPPELSADLVDRGIMLAGGGALLRGLDKLLQEETALPVHVAEDPLSAVGEGAGRVLNELEFLRKVSTTEV
jgi:hypothetical protein